jgi:hypothetical protein
MRAFNCPAGGNPRPAHRPSFFAAQNSMAWMTAVITVASRPYPARGQLNSLGKTKWWQGVHGGINKFCENVCIFCQQKHNRKSPSGLFQPAIRLGFFSQVRNKKPY